MLMDGVVFSALTSKLVTRQPVAKNADVLFILNKDFRESLTLRSLVLLCEACSMRPTAPMLAFALQNSIPGLVGLPMDNPNPEFYIDIAKRFFEPAEVTFDLMVHIYHSVHNDLERNEFFPSNTNLDAYMSSYWPCSMDCFVEAQMAAMRPVIHTKKGRDFLKEVMLGWKAYYERIAPNDPRYPRFINHLLNILEHGMILRYRNVRPGWLGYGAWRVAFAEDEHL
jgi:hypothetical protein